MQLSKHSQAQVDVILQKRKQITYRLKINSYCILQITNTYRIHFIFQISSYNFLAKIVIFGDSGVGKTAIWHRFGNNEFGQKYYGTIGIDFYQIVLETSVQQTYKIKTQLWDTVGYMKFGISRSYLRGVDGIIFCFGLNSKQTFTSVEWWIHEVNKLNPNLICILIGNKCDMLDQRVVSFDEANQFALEHGMRYYEVSAKTRKNFDTPFNELNRLITKQVLAGEIEKEMKEIENLNNVVKSSSKGAKMCKGM